MKSVNLSFASFHFLFFSSVFYFVYILGTGVLWQLWFIRTRCWLFTRWSALIPAPCSTLWTSGDTESLQPCVFSRLAQATFSLLGNNTDYTGCTTSLQYGVNWWNMTTGTVVLHAVPVLPLYYVVGYMFIGSQCSQKRVCTTVYYRHLIRWDSQFKTDLDGQLKIALM